MNNTPETTRSRSGFITGLAWTFIVLAGFATLIAVLQNVMIVLFFPSNEMLNNLTHEATRSTTLPPFVAFMFANFRLVVAGFLLVSAVTLVAAIGLLKRQNWARLSFIGIMVLGVLWNLAAVLLSFFMFSWFPPIPDTAPEDFRASFELMAKVITAINLLVGVIFAGLFGWIVKRLVSNDIKKEFLAL